MVTKHPLLPRAIPLAVGIAVAGGDWPYAIGLGVICLIGTQFHRGRFNAAGALCWFLLGATLLGFRLNLQGPDDLRAMVGGEPELATIHGTLTAEPEHRVLDQDRKTRYRTTARVRVVEIERKGQIQHARGNVAVSTIGFLPDDFVKGSKVKISGVLASPDGPIAPGLFDSKRHLKWQRIYFTLRAEATNDWTLVAKAQGFNSASIYRRFNDWARETLQRGIPEDENTRLLWAMTLGWRQGLTNEVSEPFMRTGTLHVFAISGLHIALMAWMLVKVIERAGLSRNWSWLVLPVIWFYTGATGWQASAIRSTIMSTVVIIGWILRRPNNLLNSLAASAIIILFWEPEQLFQPGFQLSFLLLLTMAVWPALMQKPWPDPTVHLGQREPDDFARKPEKNAWARILASAYARITGRDPLLPEDLRPKWRQRLDAPTAWLLGGLNLSLASLICSLPVIAGFFNLISFSSLVANLAIVPLSGIALGSSLFSLVAGWLPFLPEVANNLGWYTMHCMVAICRGLESFDWTYAYVKAPGAIATIVYYIFISCLLAGNLQNWKVAFPVSLAGAGVVFAGIYREATVCEVTALPGSGVVFIDSPWDANDLLIDCGREREAMSIVKPYLRSRGVDQLHTIVLTHGDITRVEGYHRLADDFHTKRTITTKAKSRSPAYREIIRLLQADPARWQQVASGQFLGGWQVLHPAPGEDFAKADDEAIVLFGKVGDARVLLLSDLGRLGQDRLAERAPEADIVICGQSVPEVLRPALRDKVKPKTIVLTGHVLKAPSVEGVQVRTTQKAVVISSTSF